MKKSLSIFNAKILVPIMASGIIIASCHVNDTNPASTIGGDTTMMTHTDTAMVDKTMTTTPDTSMMATDTMNKMKDTAMAKMDTAKSKMTSSTTKKKGKVSIMAPDKATGKMEMDKEGYYSSTEILPAFPGGQSALEKFFENNLEYPAAATDAEAEGIVKLSFAVDENGRVYNPMVVGKPIGYGLEDEAIRVFKKMPNWTPGRIKGKNVKTRFTLPIRFQLS